ncbi:MAG: MazG-like family protein [Candidatus Woesearchaeota archaeon]
MKTDEHTTVQELKDLTKKFSDQRDWGQFHTPKDMAMNAIIELSELLDHFRFKKTDEIILMLQDKEKKQKIMYEFSDAFYSLLRLSDLLDFDMSSQLRKKMREIAKKYPVRTSKGTNKKYDEL